MPHCLCNHPFNRPHSIYGVEFKTFSLWRSSARVPPLRALFDMSCHLKISHTYCTQHTHCTVSTTLLFIIFLIISLHGDASVIPRGPWHLGINLILHHFCWSVHKQWFSLTGWNYFKMLYSKNIIKTYFHSSQCCLNEKSEEWKQHCNFKCS